MLLSTVCIRLENNFRASSISSKKFNQIVREHGILKADAKLYTHLALTEEDLQRTENAFKNAAEAIAKIS